MQGVISDFGLANAHWHAELAMGHVVTLDGEGHIQSFRTNWQRATSDAYSSIVATGSSSSYS